MDTTYFNILLKMVSAFIIIVVYIHLSGKGSLAPISALDQVGNIVLGAIIGGPLYNNAISIELLIFSSCAWAGLLLLVRYLAFKLGLVKNALDGHSIPLMENGKILDNNFSDAHISVRDFIMLLHQRGYPNLDELSDVWFDYNGQITVRKKEETPMATTMVEDSNINYENLERLGFNKSRLTEALAMEGYRIEEVFIAEWHDHKLWIYPHQQDKNDEKKATEKAS